MDSIEIAALIFGSLFGSGLLLMWIDWAVNGKPFGGSTNDTWLGNMATKLAMLSIVSLLLAPIAPVISVVYEWLVDVYLYYYYRE